MRQRIPERYAVSFYRSLATMMAAGIPVYAIFEFLAREPEYPAIGEACGRIARRLVTGMPLHKAAGDEPRLFDYTSVRMLEAGCQSGRLFQLLDRMASQREANWELTNKIKSQLTYPLGIALLTLAGALFIPPLVLSDLLNQVVQFTDEPPLLTKLLLALSSFLASPIFIGSALLMAGGAYLFCRGEALESAWQRCEKLLWHLPQVGPFWQNLVSIRYLRMFALTYECGLPITLCSTLAASVSGSPSLERRKSEIQKAFLDGATTAEALAAGRFLPPLARQAVEVGQESGSLPAMMNRVADLLACETGQRIETVTKLVEPLVLAVLGACVATFALGCLLPIIKLAETL